MNKWDKRFLEMAKLVSTWSKDPSTPTGAVIVRPDRSIASTGFNGFPRNMPDLEEKYEDRENKYNRIIHCEMNAALFSHDHTMQGYTLYTWPFLSCHRCFVHMVQIGITRFVCPIPNADILSRWSDSISMVYTYAKECKNIIIDEFPFENQ